MLKKQQTLAFLGGRPAFQRLVHVGQPNIGSKAEFLSLVEAALDRSWLTNAGPLVQEFERRVAERCGTAHAIAVSNATVGLELVLRALGVTGNAIVPSFTFVATPHSLVQSGVEPRFCDVDRRHVLDLTSVKSSINAQTTAILGVHLWGAPCHVDELSALAKEHGLKLIFDAAHAFGCSHKGRPIGGFGDAEVFSFHATKFVNCGEGGAITTNDSDLAERLRLLRNFGFYGQDNVISVGTNAKMSEFSAAMGLVSINHMDRFIEHNLSNLLAYEQELADLPGVSMLSDAALRPHNYQYVVLEIDAEQCGLSRDTFMHVLHDDNVMARRYFYPGCHRIPVYQEHPFELPQTDRLCQRVLVLPTGLAVDQEDVRQICQIVRTAWENREAIVEHLSMHQGLRAPIRWSAQRGRKTREST